MLKPLPLGRGSSLDFDNIENQSANSLGEILSSITEVIFIFDDQKQVEKLFGKKFKHLTNDMLELLVAVMGEYFDIPETVVDEIIEAKLLFPFPDLGHNTFEHSVKICLETNTIDFRS